MKIDPDHKVCFAFYKVAKKLNKQIDMSRKMLAEERFDDALGKLDAAFGTTENHEALLRKCCRYRNVVDMESQFSRLTVHTHKNE